MLYGNNLHLVSYNILVGHQINMTNLVNFKNNRKKYESASHAVRAKLPVVDGRLRLCECALWAPLRNASLPVSGGPRPLEAPFYGEGKSLLLLLQVLCCPCPNPHFSSHHRVTENLLQIVFDLKCVCLLLSSVH